MATTMATAKGMTMIEPALDTPQQRNPRARAANALTEDARPARGQATKSIALALSARERPDREIARDWASITELSPGGEFRKSAKIPHLLSPPSSPKRNSRRLLSA